jgi:hypothetical protein
VVCVLLLALAAGCGGGSGGGQTAVDSWKTQPLKPTPVGDNGDPDSNPLAGTDFSTSLLRARGNRFVLQIQNNSSLGSLNTFVWLPPPSVTITRLIHVSTGSCSLTAGQISCTANLKPPPCTCVTGTSMTITFEGRLAAKHGRIVTGLTFGNLEVRTMTPVPYIIPSHRGAPQPSADVPPCRAGQVSTKSSPCQTGTR